LRLKWTVGVYQIAEANEAEFMVMSRTEGYVETMFVRVIIGTAEMHRISTSAVDFVTSGKNPGCFVGDAVRRSVDMIYQPREAE